MQSPNLYASCSIRTLRRVNDCTPCPDWLRQKENPWAHVTESSGWRGRAPGTTLNQNLKLCHQDKHLSPYFGFSLLRSDFILRLPPWRVLQDHTSPGARLAEKGGFSLLNSLNTVLTMTGIAPARVTCHPEPITVVRPGPYVQVWSWDQGHPHPNHGTESGEVMIPQRKCRLLFPGKR